MSFLFLVLLFCFLFFLYIVYFLSHDDFVILRTNTSMEKIFNAAFLVSIVSLFLARFFYVFFNPKNVFFNPLGFLLFPYFPGLSLMGAILGGYLISLFILRSWNLPVGRLLDFFSVGFLTVFPLGFVSAYLLSGQKLYPAFYFSVILYSLLLFVLIKFILPLSMGGKFKDGSLSLLFMFSFSLLYFFSNIALNFGRIAINPENIFSIITFFVFLGFFVKNENLIEKYVYKKQ